MIILEIIIFIIEICIFFNIIFNYEKPKMKKWKFKLISNPTEIFKIETDFHQKFIIVLKNLILKYEKLQKYQIRLVKISNELLYSTIIKS